MPCRRYLKYQNNVDETNKLDYQNTQYNGRNTSVCLSACLSVFLPSVSIPILYCIVLYCIVSTHLYSASCTITHQARRLSRVVSTKDFGRGQAIKCTLRFCSAILYFEVGECGVGEKGGYAGSGGGAGG